LFSRYSRILNAGTAAKISGRASSHSWMRNKHYVELFGFRSRFEDSTNTATSNLNRNDYPRFGLNYDFPREMQARLLNLEKQNRRFKQLEAVVLTIAAVIVVRELS
jgi:hypothetical protein